MSMQERLLLNAMESLMDSSVAICDLKSENAVIGSVFLENKVFWDLDLVESDFSNTANQIFWRVLSGMIKGGIHADLITVTQKLKDMGLIAEVGGEIHVSKIAVCVHTTSHAVHYSENVKEKARLRKIIELANDMKNQAQNFVETNKIIPDIEAKLYGITYKTKSVDGKEAGVLRVEQVLSDIEQNKLVSGIKTPINVFNEYFGGLQEGQNYVIGAMPGGGKTSMACQIAGDLSKTDIPCLFITLEMTSERLLGRIACQLAGVAYWKLLKRYMTKEEISRVRYQLSDLKSKPLYVESPVAPGPEELRSMIIRCHRKTGIKFVALDYLQRCHTDIKNPRQSISAVSLSLANTCKDIGASLFLLSQLSRSGIKSGAPTMFDLKESGQIEADGDGVIILFPSVDPKTLEHGKPLPVIFNVDKNRDGAPGEKEIMFDRQMLMFHDKPNENL